MRVAVIDNYDSFTYNLVHLLAATGAKTIVHRNDAVDHAGLAASDLDGIVLSPGPGHPANVRDFGVCAQLVRKPLAVPMLGVCLGMQGMAHHTGGQVRPAPEVVHGEATPFRPAAHSIFAGVPAEIEVGRYHSLCVDAVSLPPAWQPLGATADGTLMAMAHRELPWIGLQFHPESILTPHGPRLMQNFLEMCA